MATPGEASLPSKRTRTGCNVCRDRHLKCDEQKPHCGHCMKRKRGEDCNYGLQLKWKEFETAEKIIPDPERRGRPSYCASPNRAFQWDDLIDESVKTAADYRHGAKIYARYHEIQNSEAFSLDGHATSTASAGSSEGAKTYNESAQRVAVDSPLQSSRSTLSQIQRMSARFHSSGEESPSSLPSARTIALIPQQSADTGSPPSNSDDNPIEDEMEQHFMKVFIEEMATWMDTMNAIDYFSGNLPYEATTIPMLYNAFLACGAAHLFMIHPEKWAAIYHKEYHKKATSLFEGDLAALRAGDDSIDKGVLAKTSVVLAVYSTLMGSLPQRRKAFNDGFELVKACGWAQNSVNSEGACYWLLRGMELLTCFNFRIRDTTEEFNDDSTLGFNFGKQRESLYNMESLWARKVIGVVSKVINETGHDPMKQAITPLSLEHWTSLSDLLEGWQNAVPRTMLPLLRSRPRNMAQSPVSHLKPSPFPKMWLKNNAATFAQIIYNTGWLLLLKYHPAAETEAKKIAIRGKQLEHAHNICGIAQSVRDRPLASVIIRPCFMAGELLEDWEEQDELYSMLDDFKRQTGWPIGAMLEKLRKEQWGRQDHDLVHADMLALISPGQPTDIPYRANVHMMHQMPMQAPAQAYTVEAMQAIHASYFQPAGHQAMAQAHDQHYQHYMVDAAPAANPQHVLASSMEDYAPATTQASGFDTMPSAAFAAYGSSADDSSQAFLTLTTDDTFPTNYSSY